MGLLTGWMVLEQSWLLSRVGTQKLVMLRTLYLFGNGVRCSKHHRHTHTHEFYHTSNLSVLLEMNKCVQEGFSLSRLLGTTPTMLPGFLCILLYRVPTVYTLALVFLFLWIGFKAFLLLLLHTLACMLHICVVTSQHVLFSQQLVANA